MSKAKRVFLFAVLMVAWMGALVISPTITTVLIGSLLMVVLTVATTPRQPKKVQK
ncbi:MAG: hypothetical protein K8L97_25180 [Anaerolineae bacterium]|nr:hypothetical protein [Anaerolineae bacterium]